MQNDKLEHLVTFRSLTCKHSHVSASFLWATDMLFLVHGPVLFAFIHISAWWRWTCPLQMTIQYTSPPHWWPWFARPLRSNWHLVRNWMHKTWIPGGLDMNMNGSHLSGADWMRHVCWYLPRGFGAAFVWRRSEEGDKPSLAQPATEDSWFACHAT